MAATFGWLGLWLNQTIANSQSIIFLGWRPIKWLKDSQMSVSQLIRSLLGASQMAGIQQNGSYCHVATLTLEAPLNLTDIVSVPKTNFIKVFSLQNQPWKRRVKESQKN